MSRVWESEVKVLRGWEGTEKQGHKFLTGLYLYCIVVVNPFKPAAHSLAHLPTPLPTTPVNNLNLPFDCQQRSGFEKGNRTGSVKIPLRNANFLHMLSLYFYG